MKTMSDYETYSKLVASVVSRRDGGGICWAMRIVRNNWEDEPAHPLRHLSPEDFLRLQIQLESNMLKEQYRNKRYYELGCVMDYDHFITHEGYLRHPFKAFVWPPNDIQVRVDWLHKQIEWVKNVLFEQD